MRRAIDIDEATVARLVAEQFPRWADLPVRAVPRQGWDNRTFRLGDDLSARLPSAQAYAAAVEKEHRALDYLDGRLPIAVPAVEAVGRPGHGYPFPWSVRRWLSGDTVESSAGVDEVRLAVDLGHALRTLRSLPTAAGAAAGRHSFYRGCHPSVYSDEVQVALETLHDEIDAERCTTIWLAATTTVWDSAPVWFHGDVSVGNLLATDGRLSALIDFGTCGVGDPASDLMIAWTHFTGDARQAFRDTAGLDDATWRRARGWALWKALATLSGQSSPDQDGTWRRALDEILESPL
ncbi:aminoglycoside phosphotransferase family protein [Oerskovia turbata]